MKAANNGTGWIAVFDELASDAIVNVTDIKGHTNGVLFLAAMPDGVLASGSYDGTIKLWKDGACTRTLKGHTDEVSCLAVMPIATSLRDISVVTHVSCPRLVTFLTCVITES